MQSSGTLGVTKPRRLTLRIKVGLWLTGFGLATLLVPGQLGLPLFNVAAFLPRTDNCNLAIATLDGFALLVLGVAVTLVLIVAGIAAIVLAAVRIPAGVIASVALNAIVASLQLIPSLMDPVPLTNDESSWVVSAAEALIPLGAAVLLLAPMHFRSMRGFVTTLVAAVVLLLPGAVGLTVLALDLGGRPPMLILASAVNDAECQRS